MSSIAGLNLTGLILSGGNSGISEGTKESKDVFEDLLNVNREESAGIEESFGTEDSTEMVDATEKVLDNIKLFESQRAMYGSKLIFKSDRELDDKTKLVQLTHSGNEQKTVLLENRLNKLVDTDLSPTEREPETIFSSLATGKMSYSNANYKQNYAVGEIYTMQLVNEKFSLTLSLENSDYFSSNNKNPLSLGFNHNENISSFHSIVTANKSFSVDEINRISTPVMALLNRDEFQKKYLFVQEYGEEINIYYRDYGLSSDTRSIKYELLELFKGNAKNIKLKINGRHVD